MIAKFAAMAGSGFGTVPDIDLEGLFGSEDLAVQIVLVAETELHVVG